ncbi:MAG: chitobiase/beta-hexosaminidase C-terminal domain-containing protein [Candidatus Sumerlaeota bacterium]|nr:chitobiase/beta-hexosaminidase C-terminal domain-containing protein [Candidatus Sumerlaeota bacterium]
MKLACPPIGTIHYTLDDEDPTAVSPAYSGPFMITKENTRPKKLFFDSRTKRYQASGNVVHLKARIFDAAGKPVGDVVTLGRYWHRSAEEIKAELTQTSLDPDVAQK